MNLKDYVNQLIGCEEEQLVELEPAFILTLYKGGEESE
jgi:hypothetical protein